MLYSHIIKKGPQIYVYSGQTPPLIGPKDQLFLQILFNGSTYKKCYEGVC